MTTPALAIQPAAPVHEAPSAPRKAESPGSESSFNQVLSREMAGKQRADNERPNSTQHSGRAEAKTNEPATTTKPVAGNDKRTDKAGTESADSDKDASDVTVAGLTDALAASAEMMSLIAGAAQVQSRTDTPASPAGADVATAETGPDALTVLKTDVPPAASEGLSPVADPKAKTDVAVDLAKPQTGTEAVSDDKGETKPDRTFTKDLHAATREAGERPAASVKPGENNAKAVDERALARETRQADVQAAAPAPASAPTVEPMLQQLNAVHAVHAATNAHVDHLSPRVGTPAWDNALSQKVVWMVAGENQSASLTLNPPDLGPLQVVLNVSNSMATATFVTAQPEVKQAIENALPKLREMMGEAGVQLGQTTVSTGTPGQRDAPNEKGQWNETRGVADGSSAPAETAIPAARTRSISSGEGLVDTFV